jgi:molybdopterin/thiamine biosynthesis adenylyltransferase
MAEDTLTREEIERYARHIVLPEIGGAGQQKLKRTKVLIVGAGGLGSPVLAYLAAAGVGTLGIVDDDQVALSNLQRQILHRTDDIGTAKTASAAAAVRAINPHVLTIAIERRLDEANAEMVFADFDIIVDGSDNFATRYAVADAAARVERPLVTGAVGRFDGSLTVVAPFLRNEAGAFNPSYRDLFPEPPPQGLVPSCAEAGIIGALPGVIGTLQAMEVIKLITGAGEPLIGRLLLYDALATRFETIRYGTAKRA